jgi:RNA polymerase sigma-70 factor (ECF subfamily)
VSVEAELDRFLAGVERRAFRMAELALNDTDDALDVVQEAMFALVRRYAQRPAEEWPPLFWRILSRRITDVHRARTRSRRLFALFPLRDDLDDAPPDPIAQAPADPATAPEARLSLLDVSERIVEALRELPLRQQQAFLLRSHEGLSVAETAAAMGCAEGSVKVHLSRALARLRELLGDLHERA